MAVASLALIVYVAYLTWLQEDLATGTAYPALAALAVLYTAAVFGFSYGYHRYDRRAALQTTAIVFGVTFAFVAILVIVFIVIAASSNSKSSSSSSSSSDTNDKSSEKEQATKTAETTANVAAEPVDQHINGRRDPIADMLLYRSAARGPVSPERAGVCPSCHQPNEASAKFCANCGAAL